MGQFFAAKLRPLNMLAVTLDRKYLLVYNAPTFRLLTHRKTMYVDKSTVKNKGKTYTRYLLRESKRHGSKTIKTTLLNITDWGEQTCEAIRFVLGNKKRWNELGCHAFDLSKINHIQLKQDKPVGDVWLLHQMAMRNGLIAALGDSREGRLALWQVFARIIDQGSRLSAVRLAKERETDFLNLDKFSEKDLYKNLDWIAKHQHRIEKTLYKRRQGNKPCKLFLYDVTSAYFEGIDNELAEFGYNRDKKRGKMQIVIGLLCDDDGVPVAVEVFEGNTSDVKTFHSQIRKVADRFQAEEVVFVGDRGMIKSVQQQELTEENFGFITALTKPQIKTLIDRGVVQLELFDENVNEVVLEDGKRYVLRRNPTRADEIAASRRSKLQSLLDFVAEKNEYLQSHPRARLETALKHANARAVRLKIDQWVECASDLSTRKIIVTVSESKLQEISLLDGCYCLTTSVSVDQMDKEQVHARYKELSMVEEAFRSCKTGHLEVRPIYVRKGERTRAHVFVVMLAYLFVKELRECWRELDSTVEENISSLSGLCGVRVRLREGSEVYMVPRPRAELEEFFVLADTLPPTILPKGRTNADTERKLKTRHK
jgi:transposase